MAGLSFKQARRAHALLTRVSVALATVKSWVRQSMMDTSAMVRQNARVSLQEASDALDAASQDWGVHKIQNNMEFLKKTGVQVPQTLDEMVLEFNRLNGRVKEFAS